MRGVASRTALHIFRPHIAFRYGEVAQQIAERELSFGVRPIDFVGRNASRDAHGALANGSPIVEERLNGEDFHTDLEHLIDYRESLAHELAGAGGGERCASVEKSEQGITRYQANALCDDAESDTHGELHACRENGHGGLRSAHEMARNDGHQARLRGDAANGAAKSEDGLHDDRAYEKSDERRGHVADGEDGARGDVDRHAHVATKLAGNNSARDG